MYDAVIVGAGPAGSILAERLAQASYKVALLEEHEVVGVPRHCSGLVSPRTLVAAGIAPKEVEVARFDSARVWSPSGRNLWLKSQTLQAIAMDRVQFDQKLAGRASRAGAELILKARASGYEVRSDGVVLDVHIDGRRQSLLTKLLVGADGANSRIAHQLISHDKAAEVLPAIQSEIEFLDAPIEHIEIFVGKKVAPGWFAWLIPQTGTRALVGTGGVHGIQGAYQSTLALVEQRFGAFTVVRTNSAPLPVSPASHFVNDRVMLVGAAARQTKPSTGGGIYSSVRAAQIASDTAIKALTSDDCSKAALTTYEHSWAEEAGAELRYQQWLRWLFRHLSDNHFEMLIDVLGEAWATELISQYGDIDFSSYLFQPLIRMLKQRYGSTKNVLPVELDGMTERARVY